MSRFPRLQQWSKSSALLRAALRFAAAIINMETRLVHMVMLGRDGRFKFKQDAEWMQRAVEKSSLLEFQLAQSPCHASTTGGPDRPAKWQNGRKAEIPSNYGVDCLLSAFRLATQLHHFGGQGKCLERTRGGGGGWRWKGA